MILRCDDRRVSFSIPDFKNVPRLSENKVNSVHFVLQ